MELYIYFVISASIIFFIATPSILICCCRLERQKAGQKTGEEDGEELVEPSLESKKSEILAKYERLL